MSDYDSTINGELKQVILAGARPSPSPAPPPRAPLRIELSMPQGYGYGATGAVRFGDVVIAVTNIESVSRHKDKTIVRTKSGRDYYIDADYEVALERIYGDPKP